MLQQLLGSVFAHTVRVQPSALLAQARPFIRRTIAYVIIVLVVGFGFCALVVALGLLNAGDSTQLGLMAFLATLGPTCAVLGPLHQRLMAWADPQLIRSSQSLQSPQASPGVSVLSVPWQRAVCTAWFSIAVLAATVLVAGIPVLYQAATATTALSSFDRDALALTPAMALAWQARGLPSSAYGYAIVFTRLAFVLSFVVVSAIIIWRKPNHIVAVIVSFFLLTFTVFNAVPQSLLIHRMPLAYAISEFIQAIATALILPVLYLFPNGRFVTRWSKALLVPWCLLHMVWLFIPSLPFNVIYGDTWERTFGLSLVFAIAWYGSGFAVMLYRYQWLASPTEKQQMRWVVITWCLSFFFGLLYIAVPVAINRAGANLDGGLRLAWNLGFYALVGFVFSLGAVAFAIAILRHRLWNVDRLFSRAARYLLASLIVGLVCTLAALIIGSFIRVYAGPDNPLTLSVYAIVATWLFNPVRRRVQRSIDRKFDRAHIDAATAITHFAREARTLILLPDLLSLLMTRAVGLYQANSGAIVLLNEGEAPSLVRNFNLQAGGPVELLGLIACAPDVQTQHPDYPLLLPLTALKAGRQTQIGYLALGPRLSEQPYSWRDVDLLRSLAEQAGTAIAVAQLVEMQRQTERYHHTPAGQAALLIAGWGQHPEQILPGLHQLSERACNDSQAYATLDALPSAAMQANAPSLRLMAEGYCHLLESRTDEAMLSVGLRQMIAALSQPSPRVWPDALPTLTFHRLLLNWLNVRSSHHIADIQTIRSELGHTPTSTQHQPLMACLQTLTPVAEALAKSERSTTAQDKLCYLDEAHERLLLLNAVSLSHLDALIFSRIQQAWLAATKNSIGALRGQAELKLVLQTRHVIHADHMSIQVEVANHGLSPAQNVRVELLPGAGYQCITSWEVFPIVGPGCTAHATFRIHTDQAFTQSSAYTAQLLTLRLRHSHADWQANPHQREVSVQVQVLHPPGYRQVIANPYCAGPPLSASSRVFMGREEDMAFVARSVSQSHTHFMLIGPRRMGKTSMLKQLGVQLGCQFVTVFLDGQRLGIESGMPGFFYDAACEIADALEMALPEFECFASQPAHCFEAVFLPHVLQALQGRRLLVLFDEVEELETRTLSGRLDEAIFAWLRHIMQHHTQLTFVFAGAHEPSRLNTQLWSPAMNNVLSRRVGHLSSASTRLLITQPTAGKLLYDDLALDHLLRLVAGHPFLIQLFCHTLVDQANQQQRSFVLAEHVSQAIPAVLEMGAGQLADIWRNCTHEEQTVLMALASGHAEFACAQYPVAVQGLLERELIASKLSASAKPTYVWRLGLLQQWLQQLSYFAQDLRAPAPAYSPPKLVQSDSLCLAHFE